MDDATKELCYSIKLAVIKAIIEMKDEKVWTLVTKAIEKVGKDNEMQNMRKENETESGKP